MVLFRWLVSLVEGRRALGICQLALMWICNNKDMCQHAPTARTQCVWYVAYAYLTQDGPVVTLAVHVQPQHSDGSKLRIHCSLSHPLSIKFTWDRTQRKNVTLVLKQPFTAQGLQYAPPNLTMKYFPFVPEWIRGFHKILRINSDNFHFQNGDTMCFLWDRN